MEYVLNFIVSVIAGFSVIAISYLFQKNKKRVEKNEAELNRIKEGVKNMLQKDGMSSDPIRHNLYFYLLFMQQYISGRSRDNLIYVILNLIFTIYFSTRLIYGINSIYIGTFHLILATYTLVHFFRALLRHKDLEACSETVDQSILDGMLHQLDNENQKSGDDNSE